MFERYREEEPTEEDFELLGSNKDYHIDVIPKVFLSYGKVMGILQDVGILEKLNFQKISTHMAYSGRNKKIYKLPSSPEEASRSNLLSMMQRIHCKNFLQVVKEKPRASRSSSFDGLMRSSAANRPISSTDTMDEVYENHNISEGSRGFIGHGMGLFGNEDYLEEVVKEPFAAIRR